LAANHSIIEAMKFILLVSFAVAVAKAQMPILTALTALNQSKAALPIGGVLENTKPFDLPAGYTMREITDRFTLNTTAGGLFPAGFSTFDMMTYASPEYAEPGIFPDAGRYIFIPMESGSGGVLRYDVAFGTFLIFAQSNGPRNPNPATFNVLSDNFDRIDPCTFTPFKTILFAEETTGTFCRVFLSVCLPLGAYNLTYLIHPTGGRIFEVQRPFADTAAAAQTRWLSKIPAVSHEGLRFDRALTLYFIDESNTGSIYKYVPLVPGQMGVGQTFVLRVTAYTGNPALNWDANLTSPRTGAATWVPITDVNGNRITVADPFQYNASISTGGRAAADEVGGTPYGRPEDMAITVDNQGREMVLFAATSENAVYSVILISDLTAEVRVFCNRGTIDIATGLPINTSFVTPDNMALDADGTVFVVEDADAPVADIWQAVDADRNGVAEYMARWLGFGVAGAEPTGLFFHPNNLDTAIVNVQHPTSGNDAVWEITAAPCVVTYKMYNSATQRLLAILVDGLVLSSPPCAVNIEAEVTCGFPGNPIPASNVTISLNNRAGRNIVTRVERLAPWFLFGDASGRILDGRIGAGTYRISSLVGSLSTRSLLFTMGTCA
jgi:Bacterial protein of unknown function (DUF839)